VSSDIPIVDLEAFSFIILFDLVGNSTLGSGLLVRIIGTLVFMDPIVGISIHSDSRKFWWCFLRSVTRVISCSKSNIETGTVLPNPSHLFLHFLLFLAPGTVHRTQEIIWILDSVYNTSIGVQLFQADKLVDGYYDGILMYLKVTNKLGPNISTQIWNHKRATQETLPH
jgi:hypothetical protein